MSERTEPARIGPDAGGRLLEIVWSDGHVSEYEPRELRLNCRCAACRDELSGRPLIDEGRIPPDVHPRAIHTVGAYAIRFDWSDGHDTGIYPFDLLRTLCPCEECSGS